MGLLSMFADAPRIERVRHEVRVRSLIVERVEHVTPGMLRLTLGGDELAGFASAGFDDHVKLLVCGSDGAIERRDYTPRRFDEAARTLAIDFALHEAGPATAWARAARVGDTLQVAGPKGSKIIDPQVRRWVLIGDETALPAIGRHVEAAPGGSHITVIAAVSGPEEEQNWATNADLKVCWVHRPLAAAADADLLQRALDEVRLEAETYVWIAAEASVARRLRDAVLMLPNAAKGWTKAGGYWMMGKADAHEQIG